MGVLNADADAANNLALRATQQLPERDSLLLRFGVPCCVLQRSLRHGVLAHLRQQRRHLASGVRRPSQQGGTEVANDHVPRAVDVLLGIVRGFSGHALAPALETVAVQRHQKDPPIVRPPKARLKKMYERYLQFAKCNRFNLHVSCLGLRIWNTRPIFVPATKLEVTVAIRVSLIAEAREPAGKGILQSLPVSRLKLDRPAAQVTIGFPCVGSRWHFYALFLVNCRMTTSRQYCFYASRLHPPLGNQAVGRQKTLQRRVRDAVLIDVVPSRNCAEPLQIEI